MMKGRQMRSSSRHVASFPNWVIPSAILTLPDTVDFRTIFSEIKEGIAKIAGS